MQKIAIKTKRIVVVALTMFQEMLKTTMLPQH